jgi:hypothetical protein
MAPIPSVAMIDDGELDDVVGLLHDLGLEPARQRGGAADSPLPRCRDLLIATARRALRATPAPEVPREASPVRIAVVENDSPTLRAQLRERGFDFLVRRPVHPTALRLLLLRALYRGPERRREERLPIGLSVRYQEGSRRRSAVLADLSPGGCRLLSRHGVPPGAALRVELPTPSGDEVPLVLCGRTLRERPGLEGAGAGEIAIGVVWDPLPPADRARLDALLAHRTPSLDATSGRAAKQTGNRRRHPRRSFPRKVVALMEEASGVLMGRDLSMGGIRVEPQPGLEPGDRLRLAVYTAARQEPFLVEATVVRDDGELGLALAFDALAPDVATRLEALVAALPDIESLGDGEAGALGTVVTRIVPDAE